MTLTPFYIIISGWAGITQYGALLLNYTVKDSIWRGGIYAGMIGSAYTVMGFAIPDYEFYPCLMFMFSTASMLTCVLASYFFSPMAKDATQAQITARNALKHKTLIQVGIGLAIVVLVAACAGFTESKTADNRVQQSYSAVLGKLADEIGSLRRAFNGLSKEVKDVKQDVKGIKSEQVQSKQRGTKILQNQERYMKQPHRK